MYDFIDHIKGWPRIFLSEFKPYTLFVITFSITKKLEIKQITYMNNAILKGALKKIIIPRFWLINII